MTRSASGFYNDDVVARTDAKTPRRLRRGAPWALWVVVSLLSPLWADVPQSQPAEPTFRAARRFFLSGQYDQAIEAYARLGRAPANAVRAACGRSAIDAELGDYKEGIARLKSVRVAGEKSPVWHACLAALLAEVGDYTGAVRHNRRAIALDAEYLRAHCQLGRVLETLGRGREAITAYELCEDVMLGPDLPDDAADLTWLGRGFYRYSVLTRNPNLVQRTRHVLTEVYQEAFDFIDARYWPARLAAAELLLSKHNLDEAKADFKRVLEQNPKASAAHVGLGRVALEGWDFEEAEKQAEAALSVNPRQVAALLLLADTRMTERRFGDAAVFAERALEVNPNAIEALGVLASAKRLSGDRAAAEALRTRAAKISPAPAALHFALGRWLSAGRQYAEAETHLKAAIRFSPTWPEPRTELGQLYMDIGEEAAARTALQASFALDGFNQHTHNVLELLDRLDGFDRIESDHFIVKFDAAQDAIAAPYFSEALEAIYDEVCEDFETTLDKKTIVEVFPQHEGFSVRVTGRPFIATVGASTGRVIALAAPRGRPPFGRYNWASVLRHEFTHTVTLAVTENRIPHWMTEGLAVYEESAPRSWAWKTLLSDAVRRDRLFTLESIDWGFMRPRRPDDRTLSYAQSEWMIEYMVGRYRYAAVLNLLKAFRAGKGQARAFKDVLKIKPAEFDRGFRAWASDRVKAWGLPVVPVEDPEAIRERLKTAAEDAPLWARLALAEWMDGELDKAEKAAAHALKLDRNLAPALEVMSRVFVSRMLASEEESKRREYIGQAEPYLRRLEKIDPDNPVAIKYLGYVEQAAEQWNEAIDLYRLYQRRFPEDPDTFRRLAAIHLRRKAYGAALTQLESLFRLVEDEPAVARQIASIYADRGEAARAAGWLRRALEIDPYDVNTHGALADALLSIRDYRQAEREYRVVCDQLPEEALGYEGLSRVHQAMGNPEQAAAYKKKAEALRGAKTPKPAADEEGLH